MPNDFTITILEYPHPEGRRWSKEAGACFTREHGELRQELTHFMTKPAQSLEQIGAVVQKLGYTFDTTRAVESSLPGEELSYTGRKNSLRIPIIKKGEGKNKRQDACTVTISFSDEAKRQEQQRIKDRQEGEQALTFFLALMADIDGDGFNPEKL